MVSWQDMFEVCNRSYIEKIEIGLKRQKLLFAFDQLDAKIEADPCLEHRVTLGFLSEGEHQISIRYHLSYNRASSPFGGLFNTSVVQKLCMKPNGKISIPPTPEPLKNCGIMMKEIWHTSFNKTITNVTVSFKNPKDLTSRTENIFQVKNIEECLSEADLKTAALVAATVASSGIALVTSICLVVLCCKPDLLKKWRDIKMEKEDSNNVYGLYYTEDGQQIDQGTVEVVDVNCYYG